MHQILTKQTWAYSLLLILVAFVSAAFSQQTSVSSIRSSEAPLRLESAVKSEPMGASESTRILAAFVAAETKVREALNQHTFKRDVSLQTIGPNGEVTGEYIRNSQFILTTEAGASNVSSSIPPPQSMKCELRRKTFRIWKAASCWVSTSSRRRSIS